MDRPRTAARRRIEDLLCGALEIEPADRGAYLDRECAGDALTRAEVEALIAAHHRTGPLDRSAADLLLPQWPASPDAPPAATGALAAYDVLECIGSGGMGVVYRARDRRLDRLVALKFLPPHLSEHEPTRQRFLAEAQAAAALDHANICTIHEIGATDAGQLYLAMPWYEGETLRQRLARGRLDVPEAVDIAVQTALGLASAHRRGIVHRDVKPANLVITREGVVKILDFGIARFADRALTAPGGRPGTAAYMSPEQADGRPIDARSDIWSLGVVLHEMLAGRAPVADDGSVARSPLRVPLPASVPAALAGIIATATAGEPDARYASADEFARELQHFAEVDARPAARGSADAERRQAVILVASLSGYAGLVEHLAPDTVDSLVRGLHDAARAIAQRYGGSVNRLDAEEIEIVFGVPTANEDDPRRAVRAALELQAEANSRFDGFRQQTRNGIALHAGIDAGRVVVQPEHGGDRRYRLTGNAAGMAARLAAHAAAGEVWVGARCHRLIASYFEFEPRPELQGRGDHEAVRPFAVARESDRRTRLDAADAAGLTAFTGRETELALLRRRMEEAFDGEGQLALVVGEAGIGKSRLLHELKRGVDRHVTTLHGRCHSHGGDVGYLPFVEMLNEALDAANGAAHARTADQVVAGISAVSAELDEFAPLFLHLLGITSDVYPVPRHLHGDQLRLAMQEALAAFFTLNTRDRPAVLLLEDWHWADDASHAVLRQIAEMVSAYRLFVVVTYRPGYGIAWDGDGPATTVTLRPLEAESSASMLRALLGVDRFPAALAAMLHQRTGGNPFFLEEICHALVEDGTLGTEGATAVLRRSMHALDLPDTVQAVIRSRLDRLDRSAQDVLRVAAVVGREFTRVVLERLVAAPVRLGSALDALRQAGLIQQQRVVPEATYRFKHVLTQEVAYGSLLEHQRKELHARVGAVLEESQADDAENGLERLAYHFSRAEQWAPAIRYGMRSADRAWRLAQFAEALRLFERTQRWLQQLPHEAARHDALMEILLKQERLCETLGLRGRQQRIIDDLILRLDPVHDRARLAEVHVRQGDLYTLLRRTGDAEQALAQALNTYRELGDAVGERNALRSIGLLCWHEDRYREALDAIHDALRIDRQRDDTAAIVGDLSNLANVYKSMRRFDDALACLQEALQLAETRAEDPDDVRRHDLHVKHAYILHNLANVNREIGNNERALEYLYRADRLSREKRLPIQASYHYTAIAHILLQQGRVADSLRYYDDAVELTRRARYVPGLAQALRIRGDVLLGLARYDEALPALEEAVELFDQLKDRAAQAHIWNRLAVLHERCARPAEALAAWGRSRSIARELQDARTELTALEGLARVTRDHVAEPSLAVDYLNRALELARRSADSRAEGRLRNTLGILEWEQGAYANAHAHFERGLAIFRTLNDSAHAGLMLNSLGATLRALGRGPEARACLEEAIELNRAAGESQLEAWALGALGELHVEEDRSDAAADAFTASLRLRRAIGDRRGEAWMLHHLARLRISTGAGEDVRQRIADAERIAESIGAADIVAACEQLRREAAF